MGKYKTAAWKANRGADRTASLGQRAMAMGQRSAVDHVSLGKSGTATIRMADGTTRTASYSGGSRAEKVASALQNAGMRDQTKSYLSTKAGGRAANRAATQNTAALSKAQDQLRTAQAQSGKLAQARNEAVRNEASWQKEYDSRVKSVVGSLLTSRKASDQIAQNLAAARQSYQEASARFDQSRIEVSRLRDAVERLGGTISMGQTKGGVKAPSAAKPGDAEGRRTRAAAQSLERTRSAASSRTFTKSMAAEKAYNAGVARSSRAQAAEDKAKSPAARANAIVRAENAAKSLPGLQTAHENAKAADANARDRYMAAAGMISRGRALGLSGERPESAKAAYANAQNRHPSYRDTEHDIATRIRGSVGDSGWFSSRMGAPLDREQSNQRDAMTRAGASKDAIDTMNRLHSQAQTQRGAWVKAQAAAGKATLDYKALRNANATKVLGKTAGKSRLGDLRATMVNAQARAASARQDLNTTRSAARAVVQNATRGSAKSGGRSSRSSRSSALRMGQASPSLRNASSGRSARQLGVPHSPAAGHVFDLQSLMHTIQHTYHQVSHTSEKLQEKAHFHRGH